MTSPLSPTRDIKTRGNHVCALSSSGQMFGQGKLEEVKSHVDMIRSEVELLGKSNNFLPGILEGDLARFSTNRSVELSSVVGRSSSFSIS